MQPRKVIIAYNAEAGLFNAAKDWTSKLLWPDSNPCTLCQSSADLQSGGCSRRGNHHPPVACSLFLAMPTSWRGTLQQYVGRLHRLHDRKRKVIVYD